MTDRRPKFEAQRHQKMSSEAPAMVFSVFVCTLGMQAGVQRGFHQGLYKGCRGGLHNGSTLRAPELKVGRKVMCHHFHAAVLVAWRHSN